MATIVEKPRLGISCCKKQEQRGRTVQMKSTCGLRASRSPCAFLLTRSSAGVHEREGLEQFRLARRYHFETGTHKPYLSNVILVLLSSLSASFLLSGSWRQEGPTLQEINFASPHRRPVFYQMKWPKERSSGWSSAMLARLRKKNKIVSKYVQK